MNTHIASEIMRELVSRGYAAHGDAPNGTMGLTEPYLVSEELGDLFEMLVARREKIFGSVAVVGADVARKGYDDVVIAIEAIKAVMSRLALP